MSTPAAGSVSPSMTREQARIACLDYLMTCLAHKIRPSAATVLKVTWCGRENHGSAELAVTEANKALVAEVYEPVLAEFRRKWRQGGPAGRGSGRLARAPGQQQHAGLWDSENPPPGAVSLR